MKANAKAFAFIKMGDFSHTNHHVLEQLKARFADFEATVIDVADFDIVTWRRLPQIAWAVATAYGPLACVSRKRLHRHIVKTRYFFEQAREALLERLGQRSYAFTFQTQSLFDANYPGTAHFIYTDHTHLENLNYPDATTATPLSRSWAKLERSAYQNARMVFTMSGNVSRSLLEKYGCLSQRVECVYAGCNVSTAAAQHLDHNRFKAKNILFVGVDWERKGGPVLLEAFRSVRRAHPDATLTIVGCSPRILDSGVDVKGRVPLAEVADYYRSASIFCLPTQNEPFGVVFLEAFSYGLPIVATHLGAIPEIVSDGQSGYLVRPQDAAELADRLKALLDDPALCAEFGSFGRRRVEERYSWELTGHRLAAHIRRAAELGDGVSSGSTLATALAAAQRLAL